MGLFLVIASSCAKEGDETSSNNPTNGKTTALFNPKVTYGTMEDQDGNVYKTVTIGTKTWMAENLRTTKYNDGTAIPNVTGNDEWSNLTTGAYCNYNNTSNVESIASYGRLYNWASVNTGKLAPKGWHIPTDAEWTQLTDYLGGTNVAGGKLKETGATHWESTNMGATNESGFTALPGGLRNIYGIFTDIGKSGQWWSATESGASTAWNRNIVFYNSFVSSSVSSKNVVGNSVRCVKD